MPEIHAGDDPSKLFTKDDVIPLANLHRLDLKPGETLVVIAPPGTTDRYRHDLDANVTGFVEKFHPGVHVMTVPAGTGLDVIRPQD